MNWKDAKHPCWPIARVCVMLAALGLCLTFGYASGFDQVKDLRTMLVVGVLAGLTESIKRLITT